MEGGKRWWGTVTWIDDDGSGIITLVDPGSVRDYLFDQSSFGGEDVPALHIGAVVEFSVEEGNDGNPKAVNITPVDPRSGGDNLFDQSSFGGEDVPRSTLTRSSRRVTMVSPAPSTSPSPAATLTGAADAGEAGKCVLSAVRDGT
ncbi:hypothetical protein MUK42_32823 [Musa troglodytarum]|uniref:CSD domain-containing protein n=1 Tax=Musa troglodytarum TaxID=320322 RepID=A0A9E7F7T3_9LILI|nr:hypothetical protein MUK42_32823 [Musa troglodytarum]